MFHKRRPPAEIPSASMADIAFLLLIFFLVTTNIESNKGLTLVLPPSGEVKEVHKKNIATILINAEGKVLFRNQPIQVKDLHTIAERELRENDKMIFSVKPHTKSNYQAYITVLDELKIANATRISIAEPD